MTLAFIKDTEKNELTSDEALKKLREGLCFTNIKFKGKKIVEPFISKRGRMILRLLHSDGSYSSFDVSWFKSYPTGWLVVTEFASL